MSGIVANDFITVPSVGFLLMDRNTMLRLLRCNDLPANANRDHPGNGGRVTNNVPTLFFLYLLKVRATMSSLLSLFHRLPLPQATARRMMSVAASLAMFVGAATAQGTDPVVARLGTIAIGQEEIERLLQALPSTERVAIKGNRGGLENWLRQRVASEALMREAQGKNWAARPEVKNRIDEAVKEVTARIVSSTYLASVTPMPVGYPTDVDVAAAYEQAQPSLKLPAAYRISQIYLATPPGADAAAVAKVRDEAVKLAARARTGDFAAIAKSSSQDARSAERGGDVGAIPLDKMIPEMREPVLKLKLGQVAGPVQSSNGFHILKLTDMQAARTPTLEEVKPRLQQMLREQRQQQLARDYMAQLAPVASVTIDNAVLNAVLQKIN